MARNIKEVSSQSRVAECTIQRQLKNDDVLQALVEKKSQYNYNCLRTFSKLANLPSLASSNLDSLCIKYCQNIIAMKFVQIVQHIQQSFVNLGDTMKVKKYCSQIDAIMMHWHLESSFSNRKGPILFHATCHITQIVGTLL